MYLTVHIPKNIMRKVMIPVAEEKLPMKAEYALGLGNACRSLLFQVTSTVRYRESVYGV